ncbi:MAG: hypothetical protein HKUEN01_32270 [Candidatus Kuenenia stuttgartiensis]|nr:MAG: hypothetical protein HKUEN01_32270 [Candidatus Kuenenia stuttgartiensis]
MPVYLTLLTYKNMRSFLEELSHTHATKYNNQWYERIFCPGNLLVTRRDDWQKRYGGWDTEYKNWNDEIYYILWGYENRKKTLITPSVFFVHLGSSSRTSSQLLNNMIDSSSHLIKKFPEERVLKIKKIMAYFTPELIDQLESFLRSNSRNVDEKDIKGTDYYKLMLGMLKPD